MATVNGDLFHQFNGIWENVPLGNLEEKFDDFDDFSLTHQLPLGEYQFEENNPFLAEIDPIALGLALVDSYSLSEACLAFEAAVQQNMANADGWCLLGLTQAQNEKEDAAIAALLNAHRLDATDLTTIMALAVSYTNEGFEQEASAMLDLWIEQKFNHLNLTDLASQGLQSKCLHIIRSNNEIDPDLQIIFGILLYNGAEYEKAADCFSTALKLRPQDYTLWNRLGATLANSGKSEEALNKYKRALELRPNFVRALHNLAVSCMNLGCYDEAMRHLLNALELQQTDKSKISRNLWDTLRRILVLQEKEELLQLAHNRDFEGIKQAIRNLTKE